MRTGENSAAGEHSSGQPTGQSVTGGGRLRRRRRANLEQGSREVVQKVYLTADELADLRVRAAAAGVTVPRLLVESALAERGETVTERRALGAQLLGLQNVLGRTADNVNQIARHANTVHEVPSNFGATLTEIRRAVSAVGEVVEGLVDVGRRGPTAGSSRVNDSVPGGGSGE